MSKMTWEGNLEHIQDLFDCTPDVGWCIEAGPLHAEEPDGPLVIQIVGPAGKNHERPVFAHTILHPVGF